MWQYTSYGDEVSSIAICDDGSVIVAGSWGTYGATSGDVFTALDHAGAVIFNLLDDIDEPGSIYSVDVSDDGSFATASGKAVHARQMGNGGEVYGIQIMGSQGAPGAPDQPPAFAMGQPVPNPSSGLLSVSVEVPSADVPFEVAVFDLAGRCVATLGSGTSPVGTRTLSWDCSTSAGAVPDGVYFVRLEANGTVESRKVVILR
jgi:hypothetical protein